MKLKEYIENYVTFYEEIETFYNLQIDQKGNISRDVSTREEGSQLLCNYSCDICNTGFEDSVKIKIHYKNFHKEG